MAIERKTSRVTEAAVRAAVAEFDKIGESAFLERYGFRPSRTYTGYYKGKRYPSKAIMGAAFGYLPGNPPPLRYDEFSGGKVHVVPVLKRFGFSFDPPPPDVASVDQKPPKARNPIWTREEVVLALELYVKHAGRDVGSGHPDVVEVSTLLRQMAADAGLTSYRNPTGVAMKMMNFRSLDPAFTKKGGKGLDGTSKMDRATWAEFEDRPAELAVAAEAIREAALADMDDDAVDDLLSYTAKEGKVRYSVHLTRERDRTVVAIRKKAALKVHGKLQCEGCGFDFAANYGLLGHGFIEAHHTNPVHAMVEGDVTAPHDLALLCSNCHRMVHKAKPWLSMDALRALLEQPG